MKISASAILLLPLILLLAFKDVILYLQLEANRDFIAEVFCINKDEPMVMCYGSCYINKTISDNQEKEQHTPNPVKQKKIDFIGNRHTIAPVIHATHLNTTSPNTCRQNRSGRLLITDVFRPPSIC